MKALVYIPDMTSISLYSTSDFERLVKSGLLKPSEFAIIPTDLYTSQVVDNYCEEKQTVFALDGTTDEASGFPKVKIDRVIDHKAAAAASTINEAPVTDEQAAAITADVVNDAADNNK